MKLHFYFINVVLRFFLLVNFVHDMTGGQIR